MQLAMQALELKITDFWQYLALPSGFIEGWFLVRGAVNDFQESMREESS